MSQPSDVLTARAAAAGAFDSLFLGLGVVALIVGAVGVANIMIISVLERRSEIGLRRALGATKGQIRTQFLAESILLAVIGGVVGVLAGAAATAVYASSKGWAVVIPVEAWAGGIASAILIGAFAGLMPAFEHLGCRPPWRCERPESRNGAELRTSSGGGTAAAAGSGVPVDEDGGRRTFRRRGEVDAGDVEDLTTEPLDELGVVGRQVGERLVHVALEPHQDEAPHGGLLQRPGLPGGVSVGVVGGVVRQPSPHGFGREGAAFLFLACLDGKHPVEDTHVRLLWRRVGPDRSSRPGQVESARTGRVGPDSKRRSGSMGRLETGGDAAQAVDGSALIIQGVPKRSVHMPNIGDHEVGATPTRRCRPRRGP